MNLPGRPVSSSWVQPTQGHGRRAGEIPQMSQRVALPSSKTSYMGHSSITQLKMKIQFITYKTMTSFSSSFLCILFSTEKKVRQLCVYMAPFILLGDNLRASDKFLSVTKPGNQNQCNLGEVGEDDISYNTRKSKI